MRFKAVVEKHNGPSHGELTFLMNSLFGGFNCAVGRLRREGVGGWRVRRGAGVQSMVHPKMKWIIECGINTANNLRSPPFQTERKTGKNGARKRGKRQAKRKGVREKEGERERKSRLPSGGKSCY